MSNQIDQLPYYDPLIRNSNEKMHDIWIAALSAFIETLNGYLSQYGMFIPILTTEQRDSIQSPEEGQMIYNIDATPGPPRSAEIQVWQVKAGVAAWRVVQTV